MGGRSRLSVEYRSLKVELFRKRNSIIRLQRKTLDLRPHRDGKYVCDPHDVQALMDAKERFSDIKAELLTRKRAKSMQPPRSGATIPRRRMTLSAERETLSSGYLTVPGASNNLGTQAE